MQAVRAVTARSGLAAKIKAAGDAKGREFVQGIADDAARRANATFARDYETRTGAGAGSIVARVEGASFPVTLVLSSPVDHVGILNAGAPPHGIDPVNARLLQFPATSSGLSGVGVSKAALSAPSKGTAKRFRRSKADFGINKIVRTPHVDHPGVKPGRFMERALEAALRAALKR